jgi:hypothetical protein
MKKVHAVRDLCPGSRHNAAEPNCRNGDEHLLTDRSRGVPGSCGSGIVTLVTGIELVTQAIEPVGETTFPRRAGGAPRTTTTNRHQQLDQIPGLADYQAMREILAAWANVVLRPSLRAPYGTLGMFLSDHDAQGPKEAFLLGADVAHLHPLPDGMPQRSTPGLAGRRCRMNEGNADPTP